MFKLDKLKSQGFFVFKNFFDSSEIQKIREEFMRLFSMFSKQNSLQNINTDYDLHKLYYEHKSIWVSAYDQLRYLTSFNQLPTDNRIKDLLNELDMKHPAFASKHVVRCDMTNDQKFDFPSHQDFCFNFGSKNSITIWIPLQDTGIKEGALKVIPGSHKNGVYIQENGLITENLNQSEFIDVPLNQSDILVFSQFLVHKSGLNTSGNARFSCQIRFNDLLCPYFIKSGWKINKEEIINKNIRDFYNRTYEFY